MKIQIKRVGNAWKIIINDNEFVSSEEISYEEMSQLVINLTKYEEKKKKIDFTTKHKKRFKT